MSGPSRIRVAGDQPYDVVIGERVLDLALLAPLLGDGPRRVLVIHQDAVRRVAATIRDDLVTHGIEVVLAPVPDGEAAKAAPVAADLWGTLGRAGFTRSDAVVGLGGGAVTDLAGFVAATWLRGTRLVQVPTTLAGMVDAAIGGKTGINTAEGKNLVGAFHPPAGVVCDLAVLESLPPRDFVAGLAEVVKCGFVADPTILELIEQAPQRAVRWDAPTTRELVERSVRVKAGIVGADLRESGLREVLNYGHTLGHAVEQVEEYRWRHGDAVSVGLVFAAELARLAGRLDDATADRHRAVLTALGLPTTYRQDRWDALLQAVRRDKKTRGNLLRFVVLDGLASPARLEDPDPDLLQRAYRRLSAG
ncbi:MAG: 3-dehydroquinate synthase [Angustibacter sp.]